MKSCWLPSLQYRRLCISASSPCPPVINKFWQNGINLAAHSSALPSGSSARMRASGRFGVAIKATASKRSRIAKPTSSLPSEPPPPARSTGSQTNGKPGLARISSMIVSTISTLPSMPSLTADTGMSLSTALAWASTHSLSSTRKSFTSTVSCTVSAVTAGAA